MKKRKKYPVHNRITVSLPKEVKGEVKIIVEKDGLKVINAYGENVQYTQTIERFRERNNTLKPIKSISIARNVNKHIYNINQLIREHDLLYAVDTNTKIIDGKYISIGILAKSNIPQDDINSNHEMQITVSIEQYFTATSENKIDNIEQLMWLRTIEHIQNEEQKNSRILMIVDSDLDNIESYNNHTKMIFDQLILPDNIKLLYASADNNDSWANAAIKYCDKNASEILSNLEKGMKLVFPSDTKYHRTILNKI